MKLKSILILALVAVFVACGLDGKIKRLNKAAMKGNPKKAARILTRTADRHDDKDDWTPVQKQRVLDAYNAIQDNSTYGDYDDNKKDLEKAKEAFDKIFETSSSN